MKLSAQRVMQPGSKAQAIHAFHYSHGSYLWEGAPPTGLGHGTLQASRVQLAPLGTNHVLTYLDVVAPDEVPTARLLQAFAQVYDAAKPPPWIVTVGNCTFMSNMTHAFLLGWRQELVTLFQAAISARIIIPDEAMPPKP